MRRQKLGDRGECIAVSYLESLGWKVLDRNVHFRVAELDIVAFDGPELVFVEVRTLFRTQGIRAVDTVRRSKHRKLTLAARLYIQRARLFSVSARFDVIGVDGRNGRVVDHVRSAFLAC
jgi:putative endonuclease